MKFHELQLGAKFSFVGDVELYIKANYYGSLVVVSMTSGQIVSINEQLMNAEVIQ